jgi:hypothetical protein
MTASGPGSRPPAPQEGAPLAPARGAPSIARPERFSSSGVSSPATAASRPGSEWLLIVLFLIAIWLPQLEMTFHLFPSVDALEKRKPVAAPRPTLQALHRFPSRYGVYFRDHFGLRGLLIRWDTVVRLKLLHASPVSRLIFGRAGWIFYNSDIVPDGITIQDFQGRAAYTPADLRSIRSNLDCYTRWCQARGITCLYVIVPNKETVYPEYLPPSVRRSGRTTRLDQVMACARSDSVIHLIDLRQDLLRAKAQHPFPLYAKGGTHWNEYGAYYGYRRIMAELSRSFPRLRPYGLEEFTVTEDPRSSYDHWLDLKENLRFHFTPKRNAVDSRQGSGIRKVVVLHDSFWYDLAPFLTLHADTLVLGEPALLKEGTRPLLERERPDLVIYESGERYADQVLRLRGP